MKHLPPTTLLLAALSLGAAVPAAAQTPGDRIDVQGQPLQRAALDELRALQGEYAMSDGRVLAVSRAGRTLRASLDGGSDEPLIAAAPGVMTSADGRLTLVFSTRSNGLVERVAMTLREGAAVHMAAGRP